MAKSKSVVSVHVDIAALAWATRSLNSDTEWATWGRSFVEALATGKPELNLYAASLIQSVLDFREIEAKRIHDLREKQPVQVQPVHSVQEPVQTERKNREISQIDKKEVSTHRRFTPPTLPEVQAYCAERGNSIDAAYWVDYYQTRGWKLKSGPMVDWKAAIRTWEKNGGNNGTNNDGRSPRRKRLDEDAHKLTQLAERIAGADRGLHPAHVPISRPDGPDRRSNELAS